MIWHLSHRFDARALPLANAHYNRQTRGSPQFVPPGRCLVLLTADAGALWVTSWPRFAQHRWKGAWVNSIFRRERGPLASEMIREAVAATRARYGDPPELGMVTFVSADDVRRKRDPGRCFIRAGFEPDGTTDKRGRLAFVLRPERMPPPERALPAWSRQLVLGGMPP